MRRNLTSLCSATFRCFSSDDFHTLTSQIVEVISRTEFHRHVDDDAALASTRLTFSWLNKTKLDFFVIVVVVVEWGTQYYLIFCKHPEPHWQRLGFSCNNLFSTLNSLAKIAHSHEFTIYLFNFFYRSLAGCRCVVVASRSHKIYPHLCVFA